MLTRIDHVMICVPDLQRGIDAYTRIGFQVYPGGAHTGRGTHNAIAFHQEDYLELLSVRDRGEHAAAGLGGPEAPSSSSWPGAGDSATPSRSLRSPGRDRRGSR